MPPRRDSSGVVPTSFNVHAAADARAAQREATKYDSISSMERTQKLSVLKDLNTNPFNLEPYDASNNILQRWKVMASSKESQSATPAQRLEAAGNYYDKIIAPFYGELSKAHGSEIPDRQNWIDNAYTSALKWNMDDAYDSHWRHGLYAGFEDLENSARTGIVILAGLGHMVKADWQAGTDDDMSPDGSGDHSEMASKGIYKTFDKNARAMPVVGNVLRSLETAISHDKFWHDINPDTTWGERARSWSAEQAMLLPFFRGSGKLTEGIIAGATGETAAVPLTKLLSQSERGKTALKLLINGSEGAMYGYTMADDGDKNQLMIQGAIQQAILGTIFHTKFGKVKLSEVTSASRTSELGQLAEKAEAAQKGWIHGDADKLAPEVQQAIKGVSLAGGRPLLMDVLGSAFKHVAETENLSHEELNEHIRSVHEGNPAYWNPTFKISAWLRATLGDRKLSTLSPEGRADLSAKFGELLKHAENLTKAETSEVEQQIKRAMETPQGQQVVKDVGKDAYVQSNKQAAARASKEVGQKPIDDALDIAARRGAIIKEEAARRRNRDAMTLKTRTSNKGGRSVSISTDWNVYAAKKAKAEGLGTAEWLKGLSEHDFQQDLHDFFYPESLKKAGISLFETEHVAGKGSENPNFLAFMYNFRDRMPPIFRKRLEDDFASASRVQDWQGKTRNFGDDDLQRYAHGVLAQMDELLQTEKFKVPNIKGEVGNFYRSAFDSPDAITTEQAQLHKETIIQERKLITDMFSGKPAEREQALTAYNILAGDRAKAFTGGQHAERLGKQSEIDDLLVKLSKGKLAKWEY